MVASLQLRETKCSQNSNVAVTSALKETELWENICNLLLKDWSVFYIKRSHVCHVHFLSSRLLCLFWAGYSGGNVSFFFLWLFLKIAEIESDSPAWIIQLTAELLTNPSSYIPARVPRCAQSTTGWVDVCFYAEVGWEKPKRTLQSRENPGRFSLSSSTWKPAEELSQIVYESVY